MAELKYISEVLSDQKYQLRNPELRCLDANASRYSLLLFQPKGEIEYCEHFVRNQDRNNADKEFRQFLELGRIKGSDLVITPEYSCPWNVIKRLIEDNKMPAIGKLWVIGCESITPEQLNEFSTSVQAQCKFIYDATFDRSTGQKFLDPVCFLFSTHNVNTGSEINVAVVQFKTASMGDGPLRFETDNLILGNRFYKFRNSSANAISLISLICSDTLAIDSDQHHRLRPEFQSTDPALILHLQLNPEPRNDRYSGYRKYCLQQRDNKDIICLNWARNLKFYRVETAPHVLELDNEAASAVYSKSWARNLSEDVIHSNQKRGFYITYWATTRAFVGFLNFDSYAFLLSLTKVCQANDDVAVRSPAVPKVLSVFSWNRTTNIFDEMPQINGGTIDAFGDAGITLSHINDLMDKPLSLERLILLSCGEIREYDRNWPEMQGMTSVILGADESIRRLTFTQDNSSIAMQFRQKLLERFRDFNTVRLNPDRFPKRLERFKSHKLAYTEDTSYSNLRAIDGTDEWASVLYLGDEGPQSTIEKLHALLDNRLREQQKKDLPVDPANLAIWSIRLHEGQPEIVIFPEDSPQQINDGDKESATSITRSH